jgi:hypothetical protein
MNKKALAKAMMATFCSIVAVGSILAGIVWLAMKWGPGPVVATPVVVIILWSICDEYYKYFKKHT